MSRRLDFNKAFRNVQAQYGLSVKDEAEWMENDAAARWLARNTNRASQKADYRRSAERRTSCGMKIHRRKSLKRTCMDGARGAREKNLTFSRNVRVQPCI